MDNAVIVNVGNTQYEVLTEIANDFKWKTTMDIEDKDCDVYWQDNHLTPDQLSEMKPYQRVNHFPGIYAISRKDHLGKNLKAMKTAFPEAYSFFPATWVLPKDINDLRAQFTTKRAKTFICKPEASSQGKGIFLTRHLEDIPERCVVQRYLHKPFLIEGLKFDLRIYVLVLGCDPLRVFVHKEGLVRLATEPYMPPTPGNLTDICMHLTNYAINKDSSKFQFNHDSSDNYSGHKRSLSAFFEKLKLQGVDTETLWKEITGIIVKTVCVAQPLLAHLYRSSQPNDPTSSICFQILGFDVFIDSKMKPYLLEVNHTPSFTTDTPLDVSVKKAVVGDALRMLGLQRRTDVDFRKMRANRGVKELRNLRSEIKEKWMQGQVEVEKEFKGGYMKIYPTEGVDEYEEFMAAAREVWFSNLGVKRKPVKDNIIEKYQPKPAPSRVYHSIGTPKILHRKSNSPLFTRSIKHFYPPIKKTIKKLPALKLAYGTFVQPRLYDFNNSGQTIVQSKDIEKQG